MGYFDNSRMIIFFKKQKFKGLLWTQLTSIFFILNSFFILNKFLDSLNNKPQIFLNFPKFILYQCWNISATIIIKKNACCGSEISLEVRSSCKIEKLLLSIFFESLRKFPLFSSQLKTWSIFWKYLGFWKCQ